MVVVLCRIFFSLFEGENVWSLWLLESWLRHWLNTNPPLPCLSTERKEEEEEIGKPAQVVFFFYFLLLLLLLLSFPSFHYSSRPPLYQQQQQQQQSRPPVVYILSVARANRQHAPFWKGKNVLRAITSLFSRRIIHSRLPLFHSLFSVKEIN